MDNGNITQIKKEHAYAKARWTVNEEVIKNSVINLKLLVAIWAKKNKVCRNEWRNLVGNYPKQYPLAKKICQVRKVPNYKWMLLNSESELYYKFLKEICIQCKIKDYTTNKNIKEVIRYLGICRKNCFDDCECLINYIEN